MRTRRIGMITSLALLAGVAAWHPSANLRILTHDIGDTAPRRFQAALDFGLVGVSVLVTWTVRRLA